MTVRDLYPEAKTTEEAWDLYRAALLRARDLGGDSLAGWELVYHPSQVPIRLLSDVPGERPEGGRCRVLTVEVPGRGIRFVYESEPSRGSVGKRIVQALFGTDGAFLGMRPPGSSYWDGLPVPPWRPSGSPDLSDDDE